MRRKKSVVEGVKKHTKHFSGRESLVATVGFVLKNGSWTHSSNTACHAGLNQQYNDHKSAIEFVTSGIQTTYHKGAMHSLLEASKNNTLEYLMTSSPWSEAFPYKSAKVALKEGVIVARTDVPANIMAGGLIATRALSEFASTSVVFSDLVNAGVLNKDCAFLAALCVALTDGGKKIQYTEGSSGHRPIAPRNMTTGDVKKFLNHTPRVTMGNYCDILWYSSINDTFSSYAGETANSFFEKLSRGIRDEVLGGPVKSKNNPFEKALEKKAAACRKDCSTYAYNEEHISALVRACNKITKEVLG